MPVPRLTVTPAALKFVRRMVRFSGLPAGGCHDVNPHTGHPYETSRE